MTVSYTLGYLAKVVNGECKGDVNCAITGIAPIQEAKAGLITFLHNPSYKKYLADTKASAVILSQTDFASCPTFAIVVPNPYYAYAVISHLFDKKPSRKAGIHPKAIVGEGVNIDPSASIGPNVVIGDKVSVGKNTVIGANSVIGEECNIGDDTRIYENVTVYHGVSIGHRVIIHAGVVIGSDGFGIARQGQMWHKIAQIGSVVIGNDVEIGANTTIDRGAINHTIIKDGVKLDNQIQIGHNVKIGSNTVIAGCTGIAGSAVIGDNCIIGGGVCINGHIELTDQVIVTAMSGVSHSIRSSGIYSSGISVQDNLEWNKIVARIRQLNDFAKRLRKLEKQLEQKENTNTEK